jgi:O-antigen/teichoic acid export membrane protein
MTESDFDVTSSRQPAAGSQPRRIALNALSPFAAQVFTKLLMMGYLVVQYRLVGAGAGGALGDYFLAGTLFLYTSTVAEWGLGTLLTREAARQTTDAESQTPADETQSIIRLFTRTLSVRLLLSLLLFVPVVLYIAVYSAFFSLTPEGAWSTLIITLSLLPSALSGSVTALLYARERMTLPAVLGVVTAVLNVALGVGALLLGWGVVGLAWSALISTLVTAMFFWWVLKHEHPQVANSLGIQGLIPNRDWALPLLSAGLPLMLNALLVGLFFRADGFVIRASQGGFALEKYNAAYSFLSFVLLITPAVTLALFPRMARHAESDRPRLLIEYRFALKLLLFVSVPIVVLTVWFAPLLVTVLTGGKEGYLPDAAVALQILIFFLPLSFINGLTQYVLIALDKQRLLTGAFAVTALFNIAANLILVPAAGIYGAAFATVMSELVLLGPFLYWVRRELGTANLPQVALTAALSGGVVLLVVWALSGLSARWNDGWGSFALYLGGGLLLLVVYAAVMVALKPFTRKEQDVLRRALGRGAKKEEEEKPPAVEEVIDEVTDQLEP